VYPKTNNKAPGEDSITAELIKYEGEDGNRKDHSESINADFTQIRVQTDQLFVIRQMMEKFYVYGVNLDMLFVDFRQAFDSINRKRLHEVME
jgi:hypothetical protein